MPAGITTRPSYSTGGKSVRDRQCGYCDVGFWQPATLFPITMPNPRFDEWLLSMTGKCSGPAVSLLYPFDGIGDPSGQERMLIYAFGDGIFTGAIKWPAWRSAGQFRRPIVKQSMRAQHEDS